jgi:iron-sulfur cluster assembly accessory protein
MVTITESAKLYLKKVGQPNVYLSVKGGGCSGFTYVWEMSDAEPTIENLVVDEMAEMFVLGCTIDYVEELGGSFLKVINPNATASCGCGESFAV